MIIQREFQTGDYHVANDQPFLDSDLSWAAKGVLGYLFSKPDDWTPRMYDIVEHGPCEKYKIQSVFDELESQGYLFRRKVRKEDGTFDWQVKVFDHPRSDPGWSEPAPNPSQHGSDGGASKKDSKQERKTINTDGEQRRAREDPDPVEVYVEIMPRRPNNIQKDMIREKIGDVGAWRDLLREWRGNGWSSKSVSKMIDRYEKKQSERSGPDSEQEDEWALLDG